MPNKKSTSPLLGKTTLDKRILVLLFAAMIGFGIYAIYRASANCGDTGWKSYYSKVKSCGKPKAPKVVKPNYNSGGGGGGGGGGGW